MNSRSNLVQVKIRLQRYGSKGRPFYRIVAASSSDRRDGKFLEIIGLYHPISNQEQIRLKKDRIQHWLDKGAQPSATVADLLSKEGIWQEHTKAKQERVAAKLRKKNEKKKAKASSN